MRGTDICARSGGVIVHWARAPSPHRAGAGLLPRHAARRRRLRRREPGHRRHRPGGHNITNPLTRSLADGTGLPPLDTSRLRATWLAQAAGLLGLATFMHAAGITCSQRLGDITAALAPSTEAEAVALLSGHR